jgi:hypothetical protein
MGRSTTAATGAPVGVVAWLGHGVGGKLAIAATCRVIIATATAWEVCGD